MTTPRTTGLLRIGAAIGVLSFAAACSKPSAPKTNGDLASDLAAAGASSATSSLALAPMSGQRTDVISSVEQTPEARRAPRASSTAPTIVHRVQHHVTAPVAAPVQTTPAPVAATTPSPVAEAPQTQSAPTAAAPVMPRPQPVQQDQRHGRWRTEAEVIRDAPFPITP